MDQNNGGILGKINTPTTSVASGVWSLDSQFESQSSSIWPLAFPQTTLANSVRLNNADNAYFSRTPSASSGTTFTYSMWIKRGRIGLNGYLIRMVAADNSEADLIIESDKIRIQEYEGTGGTNKWKYITNRVFRDPSAWYHIMYVADTNNGTASDRVQLYINGVRETSFSTATNPSSGATSCLATTGARSYGGKASAGSFDGYMTELIYVDGTALDPTSFGAFNPVTNIWEPIAYAGTYGSTGFRIDFADSSALGNDVSGNNNDLTSNNLASTDQSTDTCSNNFATLNPLDNYYPDSTLSEGNTQTVIGAGDWTPITATFGLTTGKWYWEIKHSAVSSGGSYATIGIASTQATGDQQRGGGDATDYSYWWNGELRNNDSLQISVNSYGVGDIIGVALDLDNNKLYFSKNGTWQNSSNPESGATGTGAFSVTAPSSTPLGAYFPDVGFYDNSNTGTFQCNFGSPSFSISSGNADANGHGNFEYAVPSGYFALCTKNLAEFG